MDLFAFPAEIRLKIYSQLLVHPALINLKKREYPLLAQLWLGESIELCTAILRTSTQIYDEDVSVLYCDNCFHFPEDRATTEYATGTTLALFLGQIGHLARLLRHVSVTIPDPFPLLGTQLYEDYVKDLDLIRDACIGITTLKLTLSCTSGFPVAKASLDLIDTWLKALSLLKNVIVNVRWYGGESAEASDDEAGDLDDVDVWNHPKGCLAAKLRELGWEVKITRLPPVKKVWTVPNDMIEFDNEYDYYDYMVNVWSVSDRMQEQ